ncbi:MAG: DUF4469 domain-containing protein [Parabacteroides sp.]|nr:DUF4469 domain-containing protein [Parabacteroides sp.]
MDKELPADQLAYQPSKAFIRVTPSNLPGVQTCTGGVIRRRTLDIDGLAERIVGLRTEFRQQTLVTVFRLMLDEIYNATAEGFNVDFGLARTEIAVSGCFESEMSPFDKKRHTLVPRLYPSPRLKQCVRQLPAENVYREVPGPRPYRVSLAGGPSLRGSDEALNRIPAGTHPFVSVYGTSLKIAGDLPEVGLTVRCVETDESYFFPAAGLAVNTGPHLCFVPHFAFTPGEWEVTVATQLSPSRCLYKTLRVSSLSFLVEEVHAT